MASSVPITFKSPLGDDLLFRDLAWTESLGGLPEGNATLLSLKADLKSNDLLGKQVSVQYDLPGDRKRCFNGYVTAFRRGGTIGRYYSYQATIHPWLWFLTRTSDCRIFLDKKAPDIVKEVFAGHSISKAQYTLYADYPALTQCVQYRETDFNFVSRLMERHGFYYAFDYTDDGKQTMEVFDAASQHKDDPHLKDIVFLPEGGRQAPVEGYLSSWSSIRQVQPGKFVLNDFNYERPNSALVEQAGQADPHDLSKYEIYDSPFGYDLAAAGTLYAKVADEQSGSDFDVYQGTTNAYDLRIGKTLKVTRHADAGQNAKFLVTGASFTLRYTGHEGDGGGDAETNYECQFAAIPAAQQYRAPARTPHPVVHGPQLATVTGPAGDEIHTDKYGRIKVIFHWDRYGTQGKGKGDSGAAIPPDKTSCWVPVAQIWAGNNFGGIYIPRIKQEVVVEFLEGDPDRPIVTGRVYNAENPPPWALPDNKTQSGVLTRSSLGGGYANANMLRFEDKKGSEQLSIHAEKDQDISVENDETHDVGHDRTKTIGHDETTSVGNNRTESVAANEQITIGKNRTESVGANENISIATNRTESVGANESVSIGGSASLSVGASRSVSVGAAETHDVASTRTISVGKDQSLSIGGDDNVDVAKNQSISVGETRQTSIGKDELLQVGKRLAVDASDEIELVVGSASLTMKKDGTIVLKGKDITITGDGKIGIKASSDLVLKGSKIAQN